MERDLGFIVGDFILMLGLVPAAYFLIDYGILRWLVPRIRRRRGEQITHIEPFFTTDIGWMLFSLGLGFFGVSAVVSISLLLGADYPGREIVRILAYSVTTAASFMLAITWTRWKNRSGK